MSDLDKKTEDKNEAKEKIVIDLEKVDADKKEETNQVNPLPFQQISEAAKRMVESRLLFDNYANHAAKINLTVQQLFSETSTFNARQASIAAAKFGGYQASINNLLRVATAAQNAYISQALEAMSQNKFNEVLERTNRTLSRLQEVIIPFMMENTSSIIERLSEIDFSGITFDDEDIDQAVELVESDKLVEVLNRELFDKKDLSKTPLYIKRVFLFFCFLLSFTSDLITVHNLIKEEILPPNQRTEAELPRLNDEVDIKLSEQFDNSIRIVSKDELIVREGKSEESRITGTLNKNSVVQIIEYDSDWTYIIHSYPNKGFVVEGWTNTEHLETIYDSEN